MRRGSSISLDRVLHPSVHYQGDYGFIPRTLAEDGDPCDVMVLLEQPTFPLCGVGAHASGRSAPFGGHARSTSVSEAPFAGNDQSLIRDSSNRRGR